MSYFSSFLCLLVVINISFSIGFPFFVRNYPKTVVRYNSVPIPAPIRTIPAFPLNTQFLRRRQQIQHSTNKVDNIVPDDHYIEQRKIDDREDIPSDESSDLHPIYVLPPPNFQPIVYQTSRSESGPPSGPKGLSQGGYVLKRHIPSDYPQGVSSWIFGGLSGVQKGNPWEQLSPELGNNVIKAQPSKPVVIYMKKMPESKEQQKWSSIPMFEAQSGVRDDTNTITTIISKNKKTKPNDNKVMKTKLPVGLTSFFLGGMRGISGRHWQMPSTLVSQVEFMPNDNVVVEKEKSKPGVVQFDDENDFYNYNIIP